MTIDYKSCMYFEDDVITHNRMLDTISKTMQQRTVADYSLGESIEAVKAVASLIKAKADKQREYVNSWSVSNETHR